MKIKIGTKVYDANKEPVMLIFTNDDERSVVVEHIQNMPYKDGIRKYCMAPDSLTEKEMKKFMETDELIECEK